MTITLGFYHSVLCVQCRFALDIRLHAQLYAKTSCTYILHLTLTKKNTGFSLLCLPKDNYVANDTSVGNGDCGCGGNHLVSDCEVGGEGVHCQKSYHRA